MSLDFSPIDFTVNFRSEQDPKDIRITDTTDHVAFGTTTVNTVSTLLGTLPDGTVFSNNPIGTPDFDHNVSLVKDYSLTLDADGNFNKGTYTFAMEYLFSSYSFSFTGLSSNTFTKEITFLGDITTYLSGATSVTLDDQGGTVINPATISSSSYDSSSNITTVVVTDAINSNRSYILSFTNDLSYTLTKTVDMQQSDPVGKLTFAYSCYKATMSLTDETDYGTGTVSSRVITLKYPQAITPAVADLTTASASDTAINTSTVYTGGYEGILDASVSYTLATGFTYTADVDVSDAVIVKCIDLYCDIKCGLKELRDKYETALDSGSLVVAGNIGLTINKIDINLSLYRAYMECGDYELAEEVANKVKTILEGCGCTCTDCEENDELPRLLVAKG